MDNTLAMNIGQPLRNPEYLEFVFKVNEKRSLIFWKRTIVLYSEGSYATESDHLDISANSVPPGPSTYTYPRSSKTFLCFNFDQFWSSLRIRSFVEARAFMEKG